MFRIFSLNHRSNFKKPTYKWQTAPEAATNLVFSNVTDTSFDVTWTASAKTDTYDVRLSSDGGSIFSVYGSTSGVTLSVTGLSSDFEYHVEIESQNEYGSAMSTSAQVTTNIPVPATPTGFVDEYTVDNDFVMNWDDSAYADTYDIFYREQGSGTWLTAALDRAVSTFIMSGFGLNWNDTYEYYVDAKNGTGTSTSSVQTFLSSPEPVEPTIINPNETSIDVSWNLVAADGYEIFATKVSDSSWTSIDVGNVSSGTISSLEPETEYDIQISSYNSAHSVLSTAYRHTTDALVIPETPTNLQVDAITNTSIQLQWDDMVNADDYLVDYKETASGSWTQVVETVSQSLISSLTPDTSYDFRVASRNANGNSAFTGVLTISTYKNAPTAPSSLSESFVGDENRVAWVAGANANYYDIYFREQGAGTWTVIATGITDEFYLFNRAAQGLSNNQIYEYFIDAVNNTGTASSGISSFETAPDKINFDTLLSDWEYIWGSWTVGNAAGYEIQALRLSDSHPTSVDLGNVSSGYLYDVIPEENYDVLLASYNSTKTKYIGSNIVNTTTPAAPVPDVPTGLSVTGVTETTISLDWDIMANARGYDVDYKETSSGTWTTVSVTDSDRVITGLNPDTSYDFRVASTNPYEKSAYCNPISNNTALPIAAAPTGVSSSNVQDSQVTISWTAGDTYHDTFNVHIRDVTASGSWAVSQSGVTETSSTITGLTPENDYEFKVTAVNASGESGDSNVHAVTTLPALANAPTNLSASNVEKTTFDLSWQSGGGTVDYYSVEQADGGQTNWTEIIANTTNLTENISGLTQDTSYDYRVIAHNASGASNPSATLNVVTANNFILLPNSDIDAGDWSTPPLFSKVNDNFIVSDIQSSNGNSYCTIGFETPANTGTGGTLYFSISRTTGSNGLSYSIDLYKNGLVIQSVSYTEATVPLTTTEFNLPFTTSITSGDTFSVQLGRTGGGNPNNRAIANCSEMRIEF